MTIDTLFLENPDAFLAKRSEWKSRYEMVYQQVQEVKASGQISDELLRQLWYERGNGVVSIKTGAMSEEAFDRRKSQLRKLTLDIIHECSEASYKKAIHLFEKLRDSGLVKNGILYAVINRVFTATHPDKCTTAVTRKLFSEMLDRYHEKFGLKIKTTGNWLLDNIAFKAEISRYKPKTLSDIDINVQLWRPLQDNNGSVTGDENVDDDSDFLGDSSVVALNQILYGPPGTGKTYVTTELAVSIADPEAYQHIINSSGSREENRNAIKARYDQLVNEHRIGFTSFHQSFSYEDFIEGIKAEALDSDSGISYRVEPGVFKQICANAASSVKPYVIIIDEINRGNISRIFGELITLLESDKRQGASDAREVILPYSKEPFSVPANLYVLGTMNTADKSLAQLDLALRRRFEFIELLPNPSLLEGIEVHGIQLSNLLDTLNQRIEVLLDREHTIGHAYFWPLMDLQAEDKKIVALAKIFEKRIVPLLQEYFFADWERIGWVLNDPDKPMMEKFIQMSGVGRSITELFSPTVNDNINDRRYRINKSAFYNPESYRAILPRKIAMGT